MSIEEFTSWQADWQRHCIVCGKSVLDSEGYCHVRIQTEIIALCCPLCFETFEANPKRYLSLRRLDHAEAVN